MFLALELFLIVTTLSTTYCTVYSKKDANLHLQYCTKKTGKVHITLSRVRKTIVAVEKQEILHILSVCL